MVPLVLFEVYQGEVFGTGPAEFDALDGVLGWLTVVDGITDALDVDFVRSVPDGRVVASPGEFEERGSPDAAPAGARR